jgi:hypothetical protein
MDMFLNDALSAAIYCKDITLRNGWIAGAYDHFETTT